MNKFIKAWIDGREVPVDFNGVPVFFDGNHQPHVKTGVMLGTTQPTAKLNVSQGVSTKCYTPKEAVSTINPYELKFGKKVETTDPANLTPAQYKDWLYKELKEVDKLLVKEMDKNYKARHAGSYTSYEGI